MPSLLAQEAASTSGGGAASAIGWTIAILLIVGFFVALFINARRARPEIGAELELAANRKPYLSDEELEGRKLDRTLGAGLVLLAFISIATPLYWLYEPARQAGAVESFHEEAVARGKVVYETKAQCVNCHGPEGVGGVAATSLLDENGNFIASASWYAPALNTVLFRFDKSEVKQILNYGRQSTPMPAWGAPGGGPLTDQQLDNVIEYLESLQISGDQSQADVAKEIEKVCKPDDKGMCTIKDPKSPGGNQSWNTLGEALFNLGYYDAFAAGAYSCARCHTQGWSYGKAQIAGGGFIGWSLTGGVTMRHFESAQSQVDFVTKGSEIGKKVGNGPIGTGQMPGFGLNPSVEAATATSPTTLSFNQVMLTPAQIDAIVRYERGL
jgi:mono/diheme cytochrome c family protein